MCAERTHPSPDPNVCQTDASQTRSNSVPNERITIQGGNQQQAGTTNPGKRGSDSKQGNPSKEDEENWSEREKAVLRRHTLDVVDPSGLKKTSNPVQRAVSHDDPSPQDKPFDAKPSP
ncbi:hypothetical protein V1264_008803 [Littorina saxatilis]|uniref:Uncharacterized protein n=1 Tax=Littorina saxatilis TaxID=31220 RepID=A0AAN9AV69_9CAEN